MPWLRTLTPVVLVRILNNLLPGRLARPRVLASNSRYQQSSRYRSDLLNQVAKLFSSQTYLEIGVHRGLTFERVDVKQKTGVEPFPEFDVERLPPRTQIFVGTSDEFFSTSPQTGFDLIFLDGLHEFTQVAVDFVNCLSVLSKGGVIAIDDTWPRDEWGTIPDQQEALKLRIEAGGEGVEWWGDVWKLVFALSQVSSCMDWCTVTQDLAGEDVHGITLVWLTEGAQTLTVADLVSIAEANFSDHFPTSTEAPQFLNPVSLRELEARVALR